MNVAPVVEVLLVVARLDQALRVPAGSVLDPTAGEELHEGLDEVILQRGCGCGFFGPLHQLRWEAIVLVNVAPVVEVLLVVALRGYAVFIGLDPGWVAIIHRRPLDRLHLLPLPARLPSPHNSLID